MNFNDRMEKAIAYLSKKRGYTSVSRIHSGGVDLITCDTFDNSKIVFVAVMNADFRNSVPLVGLGKTKAGIAREKALVSGARAWIAEMGYTGPIRYDVLWVGDAGLIHNANIISPAF